MTIFPEQCVPELGTAEHGNAWLVATSHGNALLVTPTALWKLSAEVWRSRSWRVSARQVTACPCTSEHGVAMLNPLFIRKSEQKLGMTRRGMAAQTYARRCSAVPGAAFRCRAMLDPLPIYIRWVEVRHGMAERSPALLGPAQRGVSMYGPAMLDPLRLRKWAQKSGKDRPCEASHCEAMHG